MVPTRIKSLRVNRASAEEALLLANILNREGKRFGTGVLVSEENILTLIPKISEMRPGSVLP